MIINVTLTKSTFFFLDDVFLRKGAEPTAIDLSERPDAFIRCLILAIKSFALEADIELQDLTRFIRDIPARIEVQRFLGVPEDIIEVKPNIAEVADIDEPLIVETIEDTEDGKGQEEGLLINLLEGNVKQVVTKIRKADLSDEQKIELISIEEASKNRSIVIAAINEA